MTHPNPSRNAWRDGLDGSTQWVRRRLGSGGVRNWLGGLALLAVLVIAAVSVSALTTPVTRTGNPTSTITPLPVASPTPTPTPAGMGSASATPSPSAAPRPELEASGKFETAALEIAPVSSTGEQRSYSVRVETTAKLKPASIGKQIAGVLNDPRSWAGSGSIRFGLVATAKGADFRITLAAPSTLADLCDDKGAGVCTSGAQVVIDAAAWQAKPATFATATEWQGHLVNHGLGLLLGENHASCPKKAKLAPVMMVQAGDLDGCLANPWPYP